MNIYTPRQVATMLSVNIQTVRVWIQLGKLNSTRINKRGDSRISEEDLENYLKELNP